MRPKSSATSAQECFLSSCFPRTCHSKNNPGYLLMQTPQTVLNSTDADVHKVLHDDRGRGESVTFIMRSGGYTVGLPEVTSWELCLKADSGGLE